MKTMVLSLRDGQHVMSTPSNQFFIDIQEQHNINLEDLTGEVKFGLSMIRNLIAALLEDSEPDKEWPAEKVGRLMDIGGMDHYGNVLKCLLEDSMPTHETPTEAPAEGDTPNAGAPPMARFVGGDGQ